jgi:hypothetical protein
MQAAEANGPGDLYSGGRRAVSNTEHTVHLEDKEKSQRATVRIKAREGDVEYVNEASLASLAGNR